MNRQINIAEEFDTLVRNLGGTLVRDILGDSPKISNADYLFPSAKVVAELKCLQDDKLEDPVLMEEMENLWGKLREQGVVKGDIPNVILGNSIPPKCYRELYSLCAKPLKGIIKKANRQVRETRKGLGLHDHHGLLLLANDGNFAMPPKTLLTIVGKILQHASGEIEDFVIFAGNMLVGIPGVDRPCYFWLPGWTSRGPQVSPQFVRQLGVAWKAHHESVTREKFKEFGDSMEKRFSI